MSLVNQEMLSLYAESGINVLLIGRHGVGKTAIIKEVFQDLFNDNWRYFSAPTVDPWVDFVGIPKEVVNNDRHYIDLIRPKNFNEETVEALFIDEFNRAKSKMRNAVMELIQFKSINGIKFPNLKVVWAAINPEDDEDEDLSYDVEVLDPAQKDRFQIHIDIPYKPDLEYFTKQYGDSGKGAVEWWNDLTDEQTLDVSPRRLEYAIQLFKLGGELKHVLPNDSLNLVKLRSKLTTGSIIEKLHTIYVNKDTKEAEKVFNRIDFATDATPHIVTKKEYINFFISYIPRDIVSQWISKDRGAYAEVIIDNAPASFITPILIDIRNANNLSQPIITKIINFANNNNLDLNSENSFRTAIENGLKNVTNTNNKVLYESLQNVNSNFNNAASLETYETCVYFILNVILHTKDKSLEKESNPYHQFCGKICYELEKCLKKQNTSVMEVWKNLQLTSFKNLDDNRRDKIDKYLKIMLDFNPY